MMVFCLILLLFVVTEESAATECEGKDGMSITCKFLENINSTQTDFSVYFYPDNGTKETLVDCAWVNKNLDCIEQQGVECLQPVSDYAVISVPNRITNKTGSFKCRSDGHGLDSIKPCRFFESKGNEQKASCEAQTATEKDSLIVNCTFTMKIESFKIKMNTTVLANFTKVTCQSLDACRHQFGGSHDIFTVKLEHPGKPSDQYSCIPEHPTPQLQVIECSLSKNTRTESTSVSVTSMVAVAAAVGGVCVLTVVSIVTAVIFKQKRWRFLPTEDLLTHPLKYLEKTEETKCTPQMKNVSFKICK